MHYALGIVTHSPFKKKKILAYLLCGRESARCWGHPQDKQVLTLGPVSRAYGAVGKTVLHHLCSHTKYSKTSSRTALYCRGACAGGAGHG